jgi:hypothetical protein
LFCCQTILLTAILRSATSNAIAAALALDDAHTSQKKKIEPIQWPATTVAHDFLNAWNTHLSIAKRL